MEKRVVLALAVAATVSIIAIASVSIGMMAMMMGGGHWGMMGGRGSDPANETPVAGVTEVRISDFAFAPANIVVDVGTAVTWTNEDGVGHTVSSDGGDELDSPLLDEGETYSHMFSAPFRYEYHCRPHPNMKGLVTVRG